MSLDIRSTVEQHAAKMAQEKAEREAAEMKRATDEKDRIRINADKIEECLLQVVQPPLLDAITQLHPHYQATIAKGQSNDPRLASKQVVIEIGIVVKGNHRYRSGDPAHYTLQYQGDAERGTI